MGFIYADVELTNVYDLALASNNVIGQEKIRSVKIEDILVDTGSIMLVINESIQEHLQLPFIETRMTEMASGHLVEGKIVGPVHLRFKNRNTICKAIVLPGDSEPLLGALPLEEMDVLIDPLRQRLIVNPLHPDKPHLKLPSVRLLPANTASTTIL